MSCEESEGLEEEQSRKGCRRRVMKIESMVQMVRMKERAAQGPERKS